MKASLILLLLFLWVSPGWADTPLAKATFDTRKVDAAVDNALAEKRIVGAVILISEDGRLVYRRAAGLADREASIPVSEDTLFRLASVSKAYVSAAAMKLVEQGRLRLDEPVTKCKDQLGNEMEGHKAGWGFGYGWAVLRDPEAAKTLQSPGTIQWGGVYGNSYFMDPAKKITVVVLSNTAFEGMAGQLPSQIRAAIYGKP